MILSLVCEFDALCLPWGFGKVCDNNKIPSFEVVQVCELLNLLEHTIAVIKAPGFRNAPMYRASATTFLEYINKSGHNNTTDLRYSKRISYVKIRGPFQFQLAHFSTSITGPDLHGSQPLIHKVFVPGWNIEIKPTIRRKKKKRQNFLCKTLRSLNYYLL